jgi:hypothetical protein
MLDQSFLSKMWPKSELSALATHSAEHLVNIISSEDTQ